MRRMMFAALTAAFTVISMAPASAGGSWLDPSWERVEVGDHIELSGTVHHGQLGWINDGPFYAYLSGTSYGEVVDQGNGGAATDVPLGELQATERQGRLSVSIDFTLPDTIPAGEYWVLVCNDPCTTGLGDLIGGVLYIGMDPPPFEEEVTSVSPQAPEMSTASVAVVTDDEPPLRRSSSYMALNPYPERSSQLSPVWIGISVAIAGSVLLAALLSQQSTRT